MTFMKKVVLSIFLLASFSQASAGEECNRETTESDANYANSIMVQAHNLYGEFVEAADPVPQDPPPKQPCGAEFETSGEDTHTGPLSDEQAKFMVSQAYARAKTNAEAFCRVFGEEGCKNVEFVQYTEYDFSSKVVDDVLVSTLKIKVKWKCVK